MQFSRQWHGPHPQPLSLTRERGGRLACAAHLPSRLEGESAGLLILQLGIEEPVSHGVRVRGSVLEVPRPREDHGYALAVGGGDGLVVADRAAGLDDRRDAGLDGVLHAVGEGKVGVRGQHRAA